MSKNQTLDKEDKIKMKEFIILMKIGMNRREPIRGLKEKIMILKENKGEIMLIVKELGIMKAMELEKDNRLMVTKIKGFQIMERQTKIYFKLKGSIILEIKMANNSNSKDQEEMKDNIIKINWKNRDMIVRISLEMNNTIIKMRIRRRWMNKRKKRNNL